MKTVELSSVPPELLADLQQSAENAVRGIRDPEEMRKAAERMDRMSEEIRKKHGILDVAVPAIREFRGEIPEV
jgi:hypothetical protein